MLKREIYINRNIVWLSIILFLSILSNLKGNFKCYLTRIHQRYLSLVQIKAWILDVTVIIKDTSEWLQWDCIVHEFWFKCCVSLSLRVHSMVYSYILLTSRLFSLQTWLQSLQIRTPYNDWYILFYKSGLMSHYHLLISTINSWFWTF